MLPLWLDVRIKWDNSWKFFYFLNRQAHHVSLSVELFCIAHTINPGNARLLHSILNQASGDFRSISLSWQCALQETQQSSVRIVSAHPYLTQPHPVIRASKPTNLCFRYSAVKKKPQSMPASIPKDTLAWCVPFHNIMCGGKKNVIGLPGNPEGHISQIKHSYIFILKVSLSSCWEKFFIFFILNKEECEAYKQVPLRS